MFYLIGIGNKKEDITNEGLNCIKKADEVYLEYYTSFYNDNLNELKNFLNKEVKIADRELVEEKIDTLLNNSINTTNIFSDEKNNKDNGIKYKNKSKEKNIALLVIGDPLSATTHVDLLLRCKEKGIKYKIINNISIFTLVSRTGLQIYKFGKTTSIPFFSEKFKPITPLKIFKENQSIDAHTLFLLDINPINNNYLMANEGLEYLLKQSNQNENFKGLISEKTKVVVCSKLNTPDERIVYGNIIKIINYDKINKIKPPICIIVPGKLHFIEEEFLKNFEL